MKTNSIKTDLLGTDKISMYINEQEAIKLTGYSRTTLWLFRKQGIITWTSSITGRKILYHKESLLKVMGL